MTASNRKRKAIDDKDSGESSLQEKMDILKLIDQKGAHSQIASRFKIDKGTVSRIKQC